MTVDNLFTSTKENERLRRVYSRDRNEPFFLKAVTLLAVDDNARNALGLYTYLRRYRRKKEQPVLQRQFARMTSSICPIQAIRFVNPTTNEVQRVNVFRIRY